MTRSKPLKWHGGKTYLAKRLVALMPPHRRYCEPYFGGGAVLFQKDPNNVSEVVNDINSELMNFWNVLRKEEWFQEFSRRIESVPLARDSFRSAEQGEEFSEIPQVNRAIQFFIRYRQSRQALGKDYCTMTSRTRRGMNENVSAWLSAIDSLPEAHARLKRVEIWNLNALDVIRALDSTETFFYLDPPYLQSERVATSAYGDHEMSKEDHMQILRTLSMIKGKFMLSGYHSMMYQGVSDACGWHSREFEIDNKASSRKKKLLKREYIWTNYELPTG